MYVSNNVHKIVCATETEFQSLIKHQKKLLNKDAYSKTIYRVTRKYALNTNVFPMNNDCYEGLLRRR